MYSSNVDLSKWLSLYHSPGIGSVKFNKYLDLNPQLKRLPEFCKPDLAAVDRDLLWLRNNAAASIITLKDAAYPEILKQVNYPPPILYVLGDPVHLSMPQIAVVGSRQASNIGVENANNFARHFAARGFVVTSGLAQGIDAASHHAALAVGGKTIAVLAHGMDIIYPPKHKSLAYKIMDQGCLVSEFAIGVQAAPGHFPRRNRIISGLSLGVLVVEATIDSGSLITARYAADQGREVFAIPGAINSEKVRGCHKLIQQGAKLVESPEDVLEELTPLLNGVIRDTKTTTADSGLQLARLSDLQQSLLRFISYDVTSTESIVASSGLSAAVVIAALLDLELDGVIVAVPGGYLRRLG